MAGKTIAIKDFIGDFTNDNTQEFQQISNSSGGTEWKNRCMRRDEFYVNGGIVYNCPNEIYEPNRLVVPNASTDVSTEYAGFARFHCLYTKVLVTNAASQYITNVDFPYLINSTDPTFTFNYKNGSTAILNVRNNQNFTDFIGLNSITLQYHNQGNVLLNISNDGPGTSGMLYAWISPIDGSTMISGGPFCGIGFPIDTGNKQLSVTFDGMFSDILQNLQYFQNNARSTYSSPIWGIEFGNASNQVTLGFHMLVCLNYESIRPLSNNEDQQLVIIPVEIPLDSSENIEKAKMYGYDESENLEVYEMTFVFDESKAIEIPEEEIIIIEESLDSSIN